MQTLAPHLQNYLVKLTQQLLSQPSVSPDQSACQVILIKHLKQLGMQCINLNHEDTHNFLAINDNCAAKLLYAGHTDVVPANDGDDWQHPPFDAVIANDIIYGRGAVDMKGSIACFITALMLYKQTFNQLPKPLAIAITGDEEAHGTHGTPIICDYITQHQIIPTYTLIGEPTSINHIGDCIKIGRRSSLSLKITFEGISGHVAYPQNAKNPCKQTLSFLNDISNLTFAQTNPAFEPTSIQITYLHAGSPIFNVTPNEFIAWINFRLNPAQSIDDIKNQCQSIIEKSACKANLTWQTGRQGYHQSDMPLANLIQQASTPLLSTPMIQSTHGGASDGCYFAKLGSNVAELGLRHASAHQQNEHVPISDLTMLCLLYFNTLTAIYQQN